MDHPDLKHSPIRADRNEQARAQGAPQQDRRVQNEEITAESYDQLFNALLRPSRCWSPSELLADFDNAAEPRRLWMVLSVATTRRSERRDVLWSIWSLALCRHRAKWTGE